MRESKLVLDRKEFAVDLRHAGVDVDFEDGDGLTDAQTIRLVEYMHLVKINPELVEEHTHEV